MPKKSLTPQIQWYFTSGKSFGLPPLTIIMECSCILWLSPGMYAIISFQLVRRTIMSSRNQKEIIAYFHFHKVELLKITNLICTIVAPPSMAPRTASDVDRLHLLFIEESVTA